MLIRDVLVKWLEDNGYDGLFNDEAECGCSRTDLAPCESSCLYCQPGYKVKSRTDEFIFMIVAVVRPDDERLPVDEHPNG